MHLVHFRDIPTRCMDCKRDIEQWLQRKCACGRIIFVCPHEGCFEGSMEAAFALHVKEQHPEWILASEAIKGPPGEDWLTITRLSQALTERFGITISSARIWALHFEGAVEVVRQAYAYSFEYAIAWFTWVRVTDEAALLSLVETLRVQKAARAAKKYRRQDIWLLHYCLGMPVDSIAERFQIPEQRVKQYLRDQERRIVNAAGEIAGRVKRPWVRRLREAGAI